MPISTRVTATVGAVLLLFSAQASSAQESSQQLPPATAMTMWRWSSRRSDRVGQGGGAAASTISGSLASFERSIAALVAVAGARLTCAGALELYRERVVAVDRLTASSVCSIRMAAHPLVAE